MKRAKSRSFLRMVAKAQKLGCTTYRGRVMTAGAPILPMCSTAEEAEACAASNQSEIDASDGIVEVYHLTICFG